MTPTAKKPRAKTLKGGSVVVARESLDHLLRPFSCGGLAVSEEFQRKIWFTRLLDAGWTFKVVKGIAWMHQPKGSAWHAVTAYCCDCKGWQVRGQCRHAKVYVALGRQDGLCRLCEWFTNREPLK